MIFRGSWKTPSGNGCDGHFTRDEAGREHCDFAWDIFPLFAADYVWYVGKTLPAVTTRLAAFKEEPAAPPDKIVAIVVA